MGNTDWNDMINGDKQAFLKIYQDNYKQLFSYGFSLTADVELTKDLIQELFLEIWKTHSSLNPEVESVHSYLFTWLRRKISRSQSRELKEITYSKSSEASDFKEYSYEELLIAFEQNEEKKQHLQRALNMLTKKQLEVVKLKYYDNLSYEDIANKTSLTIRTIYNLIHEAIIRLRESMTVLL